MRERLWTPEFCAIVDNMCDWEASVSVRVRVEVFANEMEIPKWIHLSTIDGPSVNIGPGDWGAPMASGRFELGPDVTAIKLIYCVRGMFLAGPGAFVHWDSTANPDYCSSMGTGHDDRMGSGGQAVSTFSWNWQTTSRRKSNRQRNKLPHFVVGENSAVSS